MAQGREDELCEEGEKGQGSPPPPLGRFPLSTPARIASTSPLVSFEGDEATQLTSLEIVASHPSRVKKVARTACTDKTCALPQNINPAIRAQLFSSRWRWRRTYLGLLLTMVEVPPPRGFLRTTLLPLLLVVIEFLQLVRFATRDLAEMSTTATAPFIYSQLSFTSDPPVAVDQTLFWAVFAFILVSLIPVALTCRFFYIGYPRAPLWLSRTFVTTISFVASAGYIPFMRILISTFYCVKILGVMNSHEGPRRAYRGPYHWIMMITSGLALLVFAPLSFILTLNKFPADPKSHDILRREHTRFDVLSLTLKTLLIICTIFILPSHPIVMGIIYISASLLLLVLIHLIQPYFIHPVNMLRGGLFSVILYAFIAGLGLQIFDEGDTTEGQLVMYLPFIPVFVIGYMLLRRQAKSYKLNAILQAAFFSIELGHRADEVYRYHLERTLRTPQRLGHMANFAADFYKDHDLAEDSYKRAMMHGVPGNHNRDYALWCMLTDEKGRRVETCLFEHLIHRLPSSSVLEVTTDGSVDTTGVLLEWRRRLRERTMSKVIYIDMNELLETVPASQREDTEIMFLLRTILWICFRGQRTWRMGCRYVALKVERFFRQHRQYKDLTPRVQTLIRNILFTGRVFGFPTRPRHQSTTRAMTVINRFMSRLTRMGPELVDGNPIPEGVAVLRSILAAYTHYPSTKCVEKCSSSGEHAYVNLGIRPLAIFVKNYRLADDQSKMILEEAFRGPNVFSGLLVLDYGDNADCPIRVAPHVGPPVSILGTKLQELSAGRYRICIPALDPSKRAAGMMCFVSGVSNSKKLLERLHAQVAQVQKEASPERGDSTNDESQRLIGDDNEPNLYKELHDDRRESHWDSTCRYCELYIKYERKALGSYSGSNTSATHKRLCGGFFLCKLLEKLEDHPEALRILRIAAVAGRSAPIAVLQTVKASLDAEEHGGQGEILCGDNMKKKSWVGKVMDRVSSVRLSEIHTFQSGFKYLLDVGLMFTFHTFHGREGVWYAFDSSAVQLLLEETLNEEERRKLHNLVGVAFHRLGESSSLYTVLLAMSHFRRGTCVRSLAKTIVEVSNMLSIHGKGLFKDSNHLAREGLKHLEAHPEAFSDDLRATLFAVLGECSYHLEQLEEGERFYQQGLECVRDFAIRARMICMRTHADMLNRFDPEVGERRMRQLRQLLNEMLADPVKRSHPVMELVYRHMGLSLRHLGKFDQARVMLIKGSHVALAYRDLAGEARCLNALAIVERSVGQLRQARNHFRLAAQMFRWTGNYPFLLDSLHGMGLILVLEGKVEASKGHFEQLVEFSERLQLHLGMRITALTAMDVYLMLGIHGKPFDDMVEKITAQLDLDHNSTTRVGLRLREARRLVAVEFGGQDNIESSEYPNVLHEFPAAKALLEEAAAVPSFAEQKSSSSSTSQHPVRFLLNQQKELCGKALEASTRRHESSAVLASLSTCQRALRILETGVK